MNQQRNVAIESCAQLNFIYSGKEICLQHETQSIKKVPKKSPLHDTSIKFSFGAKMKINVAYPPCKEINFEIHFCLLYNI